MRSARETSVGLRRRSGASTVLIAICLTAFVAIVGLAVDVASGYKGATEVQTGVDAAALYGAMRLQRSPAVSPVDSVRGFIGVNRALNASIAVPADDVSYGRWAPDTPFAAASLSSSNSVRVYARAAVTPLFGSLFSRVTPNPTRGAIAWVANVVSRACDFKPLAIPASGIFGVATPTQSDIAALRADLQSLAGRKLRTKVFSQATNANPQSTSTFMMIADNVNQYENQLSKTSPPVCLANADINLTSLESFSGGGQGLRAKTVNGLSGSGTTGTAVCSWTGGIDSNDATCLDPVSLTAGVPIWVAYTSLPTGNCNGGCNLTTKMVAQFMLMCVFSGSSNHNATVAAESCPWLSGTSFATAGYEPGTIVGYPLADPVLDSKSALGNTPSIAQRLILVK